jgi:serine/threonine-protein kinase
MSDPAQLIGRKVGRYVIVSHLASGGMAELYVARQEAVGGFEKSLVVKMLQGKYAENPRVVRMFLDEARLAAKLNHPTIVHVYDVAEDAGDKYIAMEYIHGETLTDIVRRGIAVSNYLPLEYSIYIVSQAAAGLAYAHGRREPDGSLLRIVHRDVSPSNILVSYEGQTKIVDFGIARIQDQIREESGMRPGKASYMSPEQVRGEGADYRSDIFSLGIILYELTLCRRLWRGAPESVMKRILEEKIPPPTYIRRDYPPALELIVMKALEKRPADRYQSAEEMRHDLEEFLDEGGFRTNNRRMAQYMSELFAPETRVSEAGVARARQFSDSSPVAAGGKGKAPPEEDSEELNFDRRAPLAMAIEVAPGPAGGDANGGDAGGPSRSPLSAHRSGRTPVPTGPLASSPLPVGDRWMPPVGRVTNGEHALDASDLEPSALQAPITRPPPPPRPSSPPPGHPAPAAPADQPAESSDSPPARRPASQILLVAALLAGIATMVFLGMK